MQGLSATVEKTRLNLIVPSDLSQRASRYAKETGKTVSDIVRTAIAHYIAEMEAQKLERELEEGYKANWEYYSKMSKEWEAADAE